MSDFDAPNFCYASQHDADSKNNMQRHPRVGGDLATFLQAAMKAERHWIPACAGMTVFNSYSTRIILAALFFALMLSGMFCSTVYAQAKKDSLIPEVNILRGNFEQVRYLKGFKNPLKSEGRFLVSKSNGVVWQGIKPFPSLILVRNSGAIVNLDQKKASVKKSGKKPNAAMNKIMLAMLSGDEAELAKYFKIQRSENNGIWNLQLQPKGGMARVFTRVEVKGDRYIQKLLMEEKSGDKTELNFSAVNEVPNSLSAEELKYFQ